MSKEAIFFEGYGIFSATAMDEHGQRMCLSRKEWQQRLANLKANDAPHDVTQSVLDNWPDRETVRTRPHLQS